MSDPRIEAAAKALYEANIGLTWPKDADDETMEDYYEDARIAIAAADAVVAGTSPQTITIPEVRNDRPIPVKGGVDG